VSLVPEKLQVKLEAMDENDAVLTAMLLPIERVTHTINRQPVIISLPSTDRGKGNPTAYALDFGMMNEQLILSGVSADNDTQLDTADDGVVERPTKPFLFDAIRTHWPEVKVTTSGGLITVKGGWRLTMNEGQGQGIFQYYGLILGIVGERIGGQLRWEWKLTFQECRWPLVPVASVS
jgi:hypothetical protein